MNVFFTKSYLQTVGPAPEGIELGRYYQDGECVDLPEATVDELLKSRAVALFVIDEPIAVVAQAPEPETSEGLLPGETNMSAPKKSKRG